jgi:hypothetical protein
MVCNGTKGFQKMRPSLFDILQDFPSQDTHLAGSEWMLCMPQLLYNH